MYSELLPRILNSQGATMIGVSVRAMGGTLGYAGVALSHIRGSVVYRRVRITCFVIFVFFLWQTRLCYNTRDVSCVTRVLVFLILYEAHG